MTTASTPELATAMGPGGPLLSSGTVPRLTLSEAADQTDRLARVWPVLDVTSQIVLEATRGVREHQLNFWDAQIWATARLNQIPVVFSKDVSVGAVLEGVRFVDPFSDDFDPNAWGL